MHLFRFPAQEDRTSRDIVVRLRYDRPFSSHLPYHPRGDLIPLASFSERVLTAVATHSYHSLVSSSLLWTPDFVSVPTKEEVQAVLQVLLIRIYLWLSFSHAEASLVTPVPT